MNPWTEGAGPRGRAVPIGRVLMTIRKRPAERPVWLPTPFMLGSAMFERQYAMRTRRNRQERFR
jgi:hypothetical protein